MTKFSAHTMRKGAHLERVSQKDASTAKTTSIDPALAALFASSVSTTARLNEHDASGLKLPQREVANVGSGIRPQNCSPQEETNDPEAGSSDSARESKSAPSSTKSDSDDGSEVSDHEEDLAIRSHKASTYNGQVKTSIRKRKRGDDEDDLEGAYMRRLAQEEHKEDVKRQQDRRDKRLRRDSPDASTEETQPNEGTRSTSSSVELVDEEDVDQDVTSIPQHESLNPTEEDMELEKASRTVFLANVSTLAIKSKSSRRKLLEHLSSFIPSLPAHKPAHKVDSLRFRSTAFSTSSVPKKAAFVKKELMDATTKSTNAYVVYTTSLAAREAAKRLNGTVVLDRHLRVDGVAHPAKTDHRRCVFVGNLGFVDDESMINAAEDGENDRKPRKAKEPADIEEGLWRQFGKAGVVESVRVVRDQTTRVGKGIAYVQFHDPNAVEKALLFHGKKYPPMLPRILRVARAKSIKKTESYNNSVTRARKTSVTKGNGIYRPKPSSQVQSLSGRAGKLLGRAGAAQFRGGRKVHDNGVARRPKFDGIAKSPEAIVFEGYRASSKHGKGTMKLGGSGKKHVKPRTRSSKRGAAFKAGGGKKRRE